MIRATDWSSAALTAAMSTKKSYYFPQLKAVEAQKSKEAAARKLGVAGFQTELATSHNSCLLERAQQIDDQLLVVTLTDFIQEAWLGISSI